jgi:hypothetical protein
VDITIPVPGQSIRQQAAFWLFVTVTTSISGVVEVAFDNLSAVAHNCFRQLVGSTEGIAESIAGGTTILETLQTVPGAVWTFGGWP